MKTTLVAAVFSVLSLSASAQEFQVGEPLGTINEAGIRMQMSQNVKVFGSFNFTESCTFDPHKNLILSMNAGRRDDGAEADGYVSLINPDGSVHTSKWIGATRDGLELASPIGSAVQNGVLYTVDSGYLRSFDLASGAPLNSIFVSDAGFLNGIGVAEDGTAYISDSPSDLIYKVMPNGNSSIFAEGGPLATPNGVAMDNDGNVVVININSNAVITYDTDGEIINTEYAAEAGNDGVVVTADGTKYVSSVRFGSVSKIVPGQDALVIAVGIPSAASMCYDSVQHQLVIPMNPNNALAFIKL
ncbi:MAG: SMP-30/gluconolactonase/LRE family protein [Gammaproteobacteria bacterium]|jgi:sugar lactone lactonase YvrE|nr:SMP-30/gluconolactonase/LRE family protein [Gammaproteobacteria bacterium]